MDNCFNKISDNKTIKKASLYFSLTISAVLVLAAVGKILYPSEFLKTLDRWIGAFELLFVPAIIYFRKRWQMWTVAAVIFAAWGGYALYWHCLELPCSCMGASLHIPTKYSISFDALIFVGSLFLGYRLKGVIEWTCLGVLSGCMSALVGYAFADWVYTFMVVRM